MKPPNPLEALEIVPDKYQQGAKAHIAKFVVGWCAWTLLIFLFARLLGYRGWTQALVALGGGALMTVLFIGLLTFMQWLGVSFFESFLVPKGSPRPVVLTSLAESLVARGRYEEARVEFATLRAQHPHDIPLLRTEAEFHVGPNGDRDHAVEVLMAIRRVPGLKAADDLYATHRLIDLYLGPLNQPGRAMVELRRMADRYPDTQDGQGALAALKRYREDLASPPEST